MLLAVADLYEQKYNCGISYIYLDSIAVLVKQTWKKLKNSLNLVFRKKFTHRLSNNSFFICLLTTAPHLKYVATLPCSLLLMACFADMILVLLLLLCFIIKHDSSCNLTHTHTRAHISTRAYDLACQ